MHPTDYLVKANIKLMHFRLYSPDSRTDHTPTQKHISIQCVSQKILHTHIHTHPQAVNTGKALITVRGATKSCTRYPNLKYTLTLPFTLNIYHNNLELK